LSPDLNHEDSLDFPTSFPAVDGSRSTPDLLQVVSGFPPIQIFLLCIAFAILAIPLTHLTGAPSLSAKPQDSVKKGQAANASTPCFIRLRYAHKPVSISLQQEGKELLSQADIAASPVEARALMKTVNKGAEMIITAKWPAGTPGTVLTVELEPDGMDARSETRWSANAQLNEVITFQW
jgi:hypothetical protein